MTSEKDSGKPRDDERRGGRSGRDHRFGETTAFEISDISRVSDTGPRPRIPLFVVVNGVQRGRPFVLDHPSTTVGRGATCDVSLHGRGISRIHLRLEWHTETRTVTVEDSASTNGIFVDGQRIQKQVLREGDVVYLGPETAIRLEFSADTDALLRVRQYQNSIVDDLTGIHNRRYLMSSLEHELAFARRHDQRLCLLLVDIDYFKRVNDEHGHQVGDVVIQQIAAMVADCLRDEDNFARLGGEEFAVVSRGLTLENAVLLAERLRAKVDSSRFGLQDVPLSCSVSIGGAMMDAGQEWDVSAFIKRADENLYQAKNRGRNRVVID